MKFAILLTVVASIISAVTSTSNFCKERKQLGSTCTSCKTRVLCVPTYDDEWLDFPLNDCGNGSICDDTTGNCIKSDDPCFAIDKSKTFKCIMEGLFPDPFDCSTFYLCHTQDGENLLGYKRTCPPKQLYSANTQRCYLPENGKSCTESRCKSPGQVMVWPDDDNIYYLCLLDEENMLYPMMLRCPPSERFNGSKCVKKCETGDTQLPNTASPGNTTEQRDEAGTAPPAQKISTTPSLPNEVFTCIRKGLLPHPTNCRKYYYCDSYLSATAYDCPPDSKFDSYFGLCIKGIC